MYNVILRIDLINASDEYIINHAKGNTCFIIIIDKITFEDDTMKVIILGKNEIYKTRGKTCFVDALVTEFGDAHFDYYLEMRNGFDNVESIVLESDLYDWIPIKKRL